jgi:hypothetical protein
MGNQFHRLLLGLIEQHGHKEGSRMFEEWLNNRCHHVFGLSRYLAQTAMTLAGFYRSLPRQLKRLLLERTKEWSPAALTQLKKVPVEYLSILLQGSRQTAASIKAFIAALKPKKYLTLAETAREEDWHLVATKLELDHHALSLLKQQALDLAVTRDAENITINTNDIIEALNSAGYDTSQVLPPAKKPSPNQLALAQIEELQQKNRQYQQQRDQALARALSAEKQANSLTAEVRKKDEMIARYSSEMLSTVNKYQQEGEEKDLQITTLLREQEQLRQQIAALEAVTKKEQPVPESQIEKEIPKQDTIQRATRFIKGAKVAILNASSEVEKIGKMVRQTGDKILVALIGGGHQRIELNQLMLIKEEKTQQKPKNKAKGFGELISQTVSTPLRTS